ncbi:MAG: helix-turn-helix domain-containing protein [Steroidobacteraceae bacterium]
MYQAYPVLAQAPHRRLDYFKGLVDDLFCPMELDLPASSRANFGGGIEAANFGNVQLVKVATSPIQVRRRVQDVARLADAPYLVKFQLRGESIWCQRGRRVHARPGDFVIASTAEPYSLTFHGEYEMPVLVVPNAMMKRLTPDPDQFLGQRLPGEDADCGLLSGFVGQVVSRMHLLSGPMVQRVEANVLDLLGGVLRARARPGALSREQLLAQVTTYIAGHLQDRRLGPALLARVFGVSTRHIHALFETQPETVGRFIKRLRVDASREALLRADPTNVSLTHIALQFGFYDLSHMTRCFREQYGEPPRQFMLRCSNH